MHFDSSTDEHISGLAEELQAILSKLMNAPGSQTSASINRARWIHAEIEAIGCFVAWSAKFNPVTKKMDIEIRIHKPEGNLSGAKLEAYTKWHAEAKKRFERIKNSS